MDNRTMINALRLQLADAVDALEELRVEAEEVDRLRQRVYQLRMELQYYEKQRPTPSLADYCETDPSAPECRIYDL